MSIQVSTPYGTCIFENKSYYTDIGHVGLSMLFLIDVTCTLQARRRVFAIGAANSGGGGGSEMGLILLTIITCANPVPGKNYITIMGLF